MLVGRSFEIKKLNFLSTAEMAVSGNAIPTAMTRFHPGDECYEVVPAGIDVTIGD